ncbi:MAG: hypothetical protein NTX88_04835 [Candidatus Atribacteria bacterium]|nr:hypothetical protein [Candidatus Atribacteria bacterium]
MGDQDNGLLEVRKRSSDDGVDLLTRQAVGMRGVIPQLSPIFICLGVL